MKKLLGILLVIFLVALLTGTWIFGGAGKACHWMGNNFEFLEKVFNLFGWNKGII